MLDLRRLRLLRELHARGTVAAAAEALSYSPSTVSHQLAELQREVGVTLFVRDGRRLRLTEAAHVLVRHADALFARVERAEAEMAAAARTVAGVVRVVAFQTAAITLVAPALGRLRERHPALRAEVTEAEPGAALDALLRRECDVAVCDDYGTPPRQWPRGLVSEELFAERVHLVLPRSHPATGLRDLADAPWAGGQPGTSHERLVIDACTTIGGFTPDLRHRATDLLVLLSLVGAGQAVTLLPDLARPERDPGVTVHPLEILRRIFVIVRADSLPRPAISAVRTALRDTAEGIGRNTPE
ncbi:LysR family transcriptional regulator [Actinomadura sp. HBU206391]|uniref:LysR family transcriptional regulator n=1 Tax=Actinomadura sp. HBU206391 TaxID=2731692 RepID=UPI00164FBEEB|nr:LysR family transcriptional regulator [Actinomadura sp. HBU206391]MBC6458483.1 LysR family transcriptional regulator [Actinomadura sp. HBU206391]